MTFDGDGGVNVFVLSSLLLVMESCKKIGRYFGVICLANFVEISVGLSKILGILETEFAK